MAPISRIYGGGGFIKFVPRGALNYTPPPLTERCPLGQKWGEAGGGYIMFPLEENCLGRGWGWGRSKKEKRMRKNKVRDKVVVRFVFSCSEKLHL